MQKLILKPEGDGFVCEPDVPGTPIVGRGKTKLEALGSYLWNQQNALGFKILWFKILWDEPPSHDPVAEFHRSRGCCDGSDPSGCHRRQNEEREAAAKAEREARRVERETTRDEYAGTEPSLGDIAFCPRSHHHMRMGDKCDHCGFEA